MVAGLLAVALLFVDLAAQGKLLQVGAEIDVINSPAAVAVPCTAAVVPPAPVTAARFEQPEGVFEIISKRLSKGVAFGV